MKHESNLYFFVKFSTDNFIIFNQCSHYFITCLSKFIIKYTGLCKVYKYTGCLTIEVWNLFSITIDLYTIVSINLAE